MQAISVFILCHVFYDTFTVRAEDNSWQKAEVMEIPIPFSIISYSEKSAYGIGNN